MHLFGNLHRHTWFMGCIHYVHLAYFCGFTHYIGVWNIGICPGPSLCGEILSHPAVPCSQSPLCLPYSPFVSSSVSLLLPAALLLHRWKLLSFTVLKRMRKRVATKEFVRRLRRSVSQNLISDLVRTSLAPRSDLVKIAASQMRYLIRHMGGPKLLRTPPYIIQIVFNR